VQPEKEVTDKKKKVFACKHSSINQSVCHAILSLSSSAFSLNKNTLLPSFSNHTPAMLLLEIKNKIEVEEKCYASVLLLILASEQHIHAIASNTREKK